MLWWALCALFSTSFVTKGTKEEDGQPIRFGSFNPGLDIQQD
jgi:hypothetical protein